MKNFWAYEFKDVLKDLNTEENGLSRQEAEDRVDKYGENILEERLHTLTDYHY